MLAVPKNDGSKVNIVEQIGTKYETFGILLLRDDNGQLVSNIKYDNKENGVESIVTAIIREWLFGRGKLPVSWKTLIEILREMNLKILADDVEGNLPFNSKPKRIIALFSSHLCMHRVSQELQCNFKPLKSTCFKKTKIESIT